MAKNGKWHQFTGVQINYKHENHQECTNKINYLDLNKSNCETTQQTKNSETIKTVDSTSDKQDNYERKTPILKPAQNNCRPSLYVTKLLKHRNRLSF